MIHIVDDWYIDATDDTFILYKWQGQMRKEKSREGQIQGAKIYYYRTLDEMIGGLIKRMSRVAVYKSEILEQLSERLGKMYEVVKAVAKNGGMT